MELWQLKMSRKRMSLPTRGAIIPDDCEDIKVGFRERQRGWPGSSLGGSIETGCGLAVSSRF